jgi:23S rRNA (adenine2503-C2)-methyltransferase
MNVPLLQSVLKEEKQPAFRLEQAVRAYFVDLVPSWDDVTTFSKSMRETLAAKAPWSSIEEAQIQESNDGKTVKYLFACADGKKIETVLIRADDGRNTVCVSSQIGCPMACAFCATGTMGFIRNLTADEIIDQVIHVARWLKLKDGHVTNIVYMGMGEPFHNYDEVMKSIHVLHDQNGFNLGSRHFTISTCGVVPGILRLADEPMQINLAVSLHSAIDATRSKLMPVNKAYPLAKLMKAIETYTGKTNRKVFFEYLLLNGVNDTTEEAAALTRLIMKNGRLYHVNLIAYHDTKTFVGTPADRRKSFMVKLMRQGVPVTHRISFGEDIDAACGQLAVKEQPQV